jgi:GTP-binding protein
VDIAPPVFECAVGSDEELMESYKKYMINSIREKFGFLGVPIKLVIRRPEEKKIK